eukprot:TRINITY_DN6937_c0_g1_i1.p1 TRINITY_DN6937_c0_g1~~TRINITY_DN6937_c0_g1_i1.p1  ORF type:complete len:165 (-),score=40.95 TRINITY_DN6937_c0_g1_i1:10-504(-)
MFVLLLLVVAGEASLTGHRKCQLCQVFAHELARAPALDGVARAVAGSYHWFTNPPHLPGVYLPHGAIAELGKTKEKPARDAAAEEFLGRVVARHHQALLDSLHDEDTEFRVMAKHVCVRLTQLCKASSIQDAAPFEYLVPLLRQESARAEQAKKSKKRKKTDEL